MTGDEQVKDGRFEWSVWQEAAYEDIVQHLGNTERDQLRALAGEGGPLWTIQQGMVQYARELEKALPQCDLHSESGLRKALAMQAELKAVDWQRRMWERVLSPKPEIKEKE